MSLLVSIEGIWAIAEADTMLEEELALEFFRKSVIVSFMAAFWSPYAPMSLKLYFKSSNSLQMYLKAKLIFFGIEQIFELWFFAHRSFGVGWFIERSRHNLVEVIFFWDALFFLVKIKDDLFSRFFAIFLCNAC